MTEDGRQRTDDGRRKTENRWQRTDDGQQMGLSLEVEIRNSEIGIWNDGIAARRLFI